MEGEGRSDGINEGWKEEDIVGMGGDGWVLMGGC